MLQSASSPTPCPDPTSHAALRGPLLARLRELPFPAFANLSARLLSELGYGPVRVKGMPPRRGRNAEGGYDIEALCAAGTESVLCLVQARQWKEALPRACVDELRGAMLRRGAGQGLILSASPASPAAVEAARQGGGLLPVRLLAGEELADLLLSRHLGIRPSAEKPGEWRLDEGVFKALDPRGTTAKAPAPPTDRGPHRGRLTLTLTLAAKEGA